MNHLIEMFSLVLVFIYAEKKSNLRQSYGPEQKIKLKMTILYYKRLLILVHDEILNYKVLVDYVLICVHFDYE